MQIDPPTPNQALSGSRSWRLRCIIQGPSGPKSTNSCCKRRALWWHMPLSGSGRRLPWLYSNYFLCKASPIRTWHVHIADCRWNKRSRTLQFSGYAWLIHAEEYLIQQPISKTMPFAVAISHGTNFAHSWRFCIQPYARVVLGSLEMIHVY